MEGIHGQDVGFILLKGSQPASGEHARQQAAGVGGQRCEGVRDQPNEWKGPVLSSVPVTSRDALDQVDKATGTPRFDFLGAFHFPARSIHGARKEGGLRMSTPPVSVHTPPSSTAGGLRTPR
jgi:hypothetical protein